MTATYVYRVFDADDRLLYIGCSKDVGARMGQHFESSHWHCFHARVETEFFPTRDLALAAEALAIQTEHPRWNVQDRSDDHPDGQIGNISQAHWLRGEIEVSRSLRDARTKRAQYIRQLRYLDQKIEQTLLLADLVSGGPRVQYEFDYDLNGPISNTEKRRRLVAGNLPVRNDSLRDVS